MSIRNEVQAVIDGIMKGGERTVQKQVAVQTWRDGRVARQDFYHG